MDNFLEMFRSPKKIRQFMEANGIAFNKKLGQNFLINLNIVSRIVKSAKISGCGVVEIGAGLGVLTSFLARSAVKVVAIELDGGLCEILKFLFADAANVTILNCDVLKTDLAHIIKTEFAGLPVKICANLPYYLTSKFIAGVLENRLDVKSITVMVQKQAALRLCAKPGSFDCSYISYLINYYCEPKILFDVSPGNFYPIPKVHSSVVSFDVMKKLQKNLVGLDQEAGFFRFLRAAFSQRRKIILNLLSSFLNIDKLRLKFIMVEQGLNPNSRAQQLTLQQFAQLFNIVNGD